MSTRHILILVIGFCSWHSYGKVPEVRVLIGKKKNNVVVQGNDLSQYFYTLKRKKFFEGQKTLRFRCRSKKLSKAKRSAPTLVASVAAGFGLINWEKSSYRGEILLLANKSGKDCNVVNKVSLEHYISALLAKEMNSEWPVEALKAQAVAARSYAYHKIHSREVSKKSGHEAFYDLENSEKHQVTGSFLDETKRTTMASKMTKGEILVNQNENIIPVFFHSKCGGRTLSPHQVWGGFMGEYSSVKCPFCHQHGKKPWKRKMKVQKFDESLQYALEKYYAVPDNQRLTKLSLAPDTKNRAELMYYAKSELKALRKASLRKVLGRKTLPSNNFKIKKQGEFIEIEGSGYGHGVGMCQLGALELAKKGYSYKQILSYYFPKLKIKKLY